MALVSKVFAPVDADRSLYVFCCNKRSCSLQPGAWTVIRNQLSDSNVDPATVVKQEATPTSSAPAPTKQNKPATAWSFDEPGKIDNDDDDDLLALLATRDLSISKPVKDKNKKQDTHHAPTPLKQQQGHLHTPVAFPLVTLTEYDEEWDEEYYTMSLGVDVHEEHIDRLLATYLRDEEDVENLSALHHAGLNGVREGMCASLAMPSTPLADPSASLQEEGEDDNEEERDIKTASETEEYFQRRVQVSPNQVLRYAYDGIPLWITSPSPLENNVSAVPICELCGSKRVFECQLMPALLSHLTSSRKSDKKAKDGKAGQGEVADAGQGDLRNRLKNMLGSELDFGVVTIWSCPRSCDPPVGSFAMEVALIQPPPDTLSMEL
ncbi:hypothetical protein EON65_02525 [archaeon]|nr:MAG: hypothetical protein EON65_02525 [archaeon]